MASDKRLLPSGVIPPRRRPGLRARPARFFVTGDDAIRSSAAIGRLMQDQAREMCRRFSSEVLPGFGSVDSGKPDARLSIVGSDHINGAAVDNAWHLACEDRTGVPRLAGRRLFLRAVIRHCRARGRLRPRVRDHLAALVHEEVKPGQVPGSELLFVEIDPVKHDPASGLVERKADATLGHRK